jgi:hypothetical protein
MFEIRQSKGVHRAALAIVIAAFAMLLLRPFCDLAFAAAVQGDMAPAAAMAGHGTAGHAGSGTPLSTPCCAFVSNETLVNPAGLVSAGMPDALLGAALFLLVSLPLFARSRHSVRFCLAAPPNRPFYARSARILR